MQKVAIVGFGFMGTMHAQVYARLPAVRLVGVVERHAGRTRRALARLELDAPVFGEMKDMLDACNPDVVDICLPTDLHAGFALQAIAAGRHVFCEKPLALTLAEGTRMVAAARKAGVLLQVGHCIRFWPEYQALEAFVRGGRAGALRSLSLQRLCGRLMGSVDNWMNDGTRSGGGALDLHIHDTDYVHHLLGRPEAVTSAGTKDESGWSHIVTVYRFPNAAVTAEGGWNFPPKRDFQMSFQAVFERGALEYDCRATPTLTFVPARGSRRPLPYAAPGAGESVTGAGNISALGGYYNELAYFIDCLEGGRAPRVATGAQAVDSLATALAEIRSAGTGRTVVLPRERGGRA